MRCGPNLGLLYYALMRHNSKRVFIHNVHVRIDIHLSARIQNAIQIILSNADGYFLNLGLKTSIYLKAHPHHLLTVVLT